MKKFAAILSVSMLAACVYAGNVDIWSGRNKMFQVWQTKEIFFYDAEAGEEYLTESKTVTEEKIDRNQVLVTKVNDVMFFSKTQRIDFYSSNKLTVNKDAIMSSSYTPVRIKEDGKFEVFGESNINGKNYMLVHQGKSNDVLLIDEQGGLYDRIGRVVDGRLAILDIQFFVEPEDVLFTPIVNTRSEVSDVVSGYEVRYNGVTNNYVRFSYTTFGNNPQTEELMFPISQQTIDIKGFRINIIEAGYDKIEYVIL